MKTAYDKRTKPKLQITFKDATIIAGLLKGYAKLLSNIDYSNHKGDEVASLLRCEMQDALKYRAILLGDTPQPYEDLYASG